MFLYPSNDGNGRVHLVKYYIAFEKIEGKQKGNLDFQTNISVGMIEVLKAKTELSDATKCT
jgi:hypothetical protein